MIIAHKNRHVILFNIMAIVVLFLFSISILYTNVYAATILKTETSHLAAKLLLSDEEGRERLQATNICLAIVDRARREKSIQDIYLDDILLCLRGDHKSNISPGDIEELKSCKIEALPGEIRIYLAINNILIRYYDPTFSSSKTLIPYTNFQKTRSEVVNPRLNFQILHSVSALPVEKYREKPVIVRQVQDKGSEDDWKHVLKSKIESAFALGARNFFPANNRRYMRNSLKQNAIAIFDLEDSLSPHQKEEGRHSLIESFNDSGFLAALDASKRSLWIRINDVRSPYVARDLVEVISHPAIGSRIDGILLPKVETVNDVKVIQSILKTIQRRHTGEEVEGWQPGRLRIQATIESARGVEHVDEIAGQPSVVALIAGLVDYKKSVGSWDQHHQYPDSMFEKIEVARAAIAHGVLPVESITTSLDYDEAFQDAQKAIRMGFSMKASVHPIHMKAISAAGEWPKNDFEIRDYDTDKNVEEYDWNTLVRKASDNLPLIDDVDREGAAQRLYGGGVKGVVWRVGTDWTDFDKARSAKVDTVHIVIRGVPGDIDKAKAIFHELKKNSHIQETALDITLPGTEKDAKRLITTILSGFRTADTILLRGKDLNAETVAKVSRYMDEYENSNPTLSGHSTHIGVVVTDEAQFNALPRILDQSWRINSVINDYAPVYTGPDVSLDKFLTAQDIQSPTAIKIGGILNAAAARSISAVQGRVDSKDFLYQQASLAAKNGYRGFVITDPDDALVVEKALRPGQAFIVEAIESVKHMHMAEGRYVISERTGPDGKREEAVHEKSLEEIIGAIRVELREPFDKKKEDENPGIVRYNMVDKATQLMMTGVLNRARELHYNIVRNGSKGLLSLEELRDIELYANPKLSEDGRGIDFTEYEPIWDSDGSDRYHKIRNRIDKKVYMESDNGRYPIPYNNIDAPQKLIIPPSGERNIYVEGRSRIPDVEQIFVERTYGAKKTIMRFSAKMIDGSYRLNDGGASTSLPAKNKIRIEKCLNTLVEVVRKKLPDFTLVVTTDLDKTQNYITASNISTRTIYMSPVFFRRPEDRQLIALYHELVSRIVNNENDMARAMRNSIKFMGYFKSQYNDSSGFGPLEPIQDGRRNDIGIGYVMDNLIKKSDSIQDFPYINIVQQAKKEADRYLQDKKLKGLPSHYIDNIEISIVKPKHPPHLDFEGLLFINENWRQFTHVAQNDPETGNPTIYIPERLAQRLTSGFEWGGKPHHILVALLVRDILNILGTHVDEQDMIYREYLTSHGFDEDIVEELFAVLSENKIPTFGKIFGNWAEAFKGSGKTLFKYYDTRDNEYKDITWDESEEEVRNIGKNLLGLVNPGEEGHRVAIFMRDTPQSAYFDIASLSLGIVDAHIRNLLKAELGNVTGMLLELKPRVIVVNNREQLEKLRTIRNKIPFVKTIVVTDENSGDLGPMEHIKVMGMDGFRRVAEERGVSDSDYYNAVRKVRLDDVATVVFTSGTTGRPKGVKITQRNLVIKRMAYSIAFPEITRDDVVFGYLPFSHNFGRLTDFLGTIYAGATYTFSRSTIERKIIEDLSVVQPTVLRAAPNLWEAIRKNVLEALSDNPGHEDTSRKLKEIVGGKLKIAFNGAAPLEPETVKWFHDNEVSLDAGYGFSENSGSGTTLARTKRDFKLGTLGKPLPGVVLKLGTWLNPISGEEVRNVLFANSPWISIGYADPARNVGKFLPTGWFATGDVMSLDQQGNYVFFRRDSGLAKSQQGLLIDMKRVESIIELENAIRYAHVVADKKPFNTVLIWPDRGYFERQSDLRGHPFSRDEVCRYFDSLIDKVNEESLERYERITKVVLMGYGEPPSGLVDGMKGTLFHRKINSAYKNLIDSIYLDDPSTKVIFASDIVAADSSEAISMEQDPNAPIAGEKLSDRPRVLADHILSYGNTGLFKVLANESKERILIRVPVEALESLEDINVKTILNALENAPNIYIELFYATGFGKVSEGQYRRHGLDKALPENFIRTRENTITLLCLLDDKDLSMQLIRMRLGDMGLNPTDTILSPIGIVDNSMELTRGLFLGLRMLHISRQKKGIGKVDEGFVEETVEWCRELSRIHKSAVFDLTPEDIVNLSTGEINNLCRSLHKLVKALPIIPVDPKELKREFERTAQILSGA